MDYSRIYEDFIADRRSAPEPNGYSEKHHVLPRCLGGTDDAANLIDLTPEDHYFAHILLARIHGGKLWHAVECMGRLPAGERDLHALKSRVGYGIARRKSAEWFSERFSGDGNPAFDRNTYVFRSADGEQVEGPRPEVALATGLTQSNISSLICGSNRSLHGWFSTLHFESWKGVEAANWKGRGCQDSIRLIHLDGRTWEGRLSDFRRQFGRPLFFQTDSGHCAGWFRCQSHIAPWVKADQANRQSAADARGDISAGSNPNADSTRYLFKRGEASLSLTRSEFAASFGVHHLKVTQLLNGDLKSLEGWTTEPKIKRLPASQRIRFRHESGESREGLVKDFVREFSLPRSSIVRAIAKGEKYQGWKFEVING